MARPKSNLTRKINAIANTYGVASSTVRRWHDQGCNIFDPGEIISWRQKKTENRKRGAAVAPNLEAALNGHRRDSVGMINMEILEKLSQTSGEGGGRGAEAVTGARIHFL